MLCTHSFSLIKQLVFCFIFTSPKFQKYVIIISDNQYIGGGSYRPFGDDPVTLVSQLSQCWGQIQFPRTITTHIIQFQKIKSEMASVPTVPVMSNARSLVKFKTPSLFVST